MEMQAYAEKRWKMKSKQVTWDSPGIFIIHFCLLLLKVFVFKNQNT